MLWVKKKCYENAVSMKILQTSYEYIKYKHNFG